VIVLSIDTCDSRGSVAVLRDDTLLASVAHQTSDDYSVWLLPAVGRCLEHAGLSMKDVGLYAAAAGPGSFTGIRIGLTTVKAWSEVYGCPIVAVSRLHALAQQAVGEGTRVAAFIDGRRGQVFGALFERVDSNLVLSGDEMVISPANFIQYSAEQAGRQRVAWVSLDPQLLTNLEQWRARANEGERMECVKPMLADVIGRIGLAKVSVGQTQDALTVDANYLRRTDAEVLWKGGARSES
jgi:tRNA threonylcarbamoyl adenosine modification protein YeaZ